MPLELLLREIDDASHEVGNLRARAAIRETSTDQSDNGVVGNGNSVNSNSVNSNSNYKINSSVNGSFGSSATISG